MLTGLVWGTIPLSFSIIIYPVLFQGGFKNIYTIFYDLFYSFQSDFLLLLMAITLLITLVHTYYTRLHEFLLLFERTTFNKKTKLAPYSMVLAISFLYGIYLLYKPSLLELFFFSGVLHAALLIPMLFILFSKKNLPRQIITISVLASAVTGFISYFFLELHVSVLIPTITSFAILGGYDLFTKLKSGA